MNMFQYALHIVLNEPIDFTAVSLIHPGYINIIVDNVIHSIH